MKEERRWLLEAAGSPTVNFDKEVYYRKVGFTRMKAKYSNAAGTKCVIISSYKEVVAESKDISWNTSGTLNYYITPVSPVGLYKTELRKDGTVVASDTAEVRGKPTCSIGDKYCLGADLWRCVYGTMELYERNHPLCWRPGYTNTGMTTPDTLRLEEGRYDVLIAKEWYHDKVYNNISVEKGKTKDLVVVLPKKPKGVLSCESNPKGARIWLKKK